ncbi:MAG: MIP family channel protein [Defluviitaleaceae bacterium]|nr:MIP family channel protein [Defluviitaleaceae bacterium]
MRKYLAEVIGTFVLVFMGCGAAMLLGVGAEGGHLAVAFAFGLSIVAMAYVIGGVSGCHINPAVSLSMFLDKRLSAKDFVGYVIAQVVGAIAGGALLFLMVEVFGVADATGGLGSNAVGDLGIGGAFVVEIVLTFIFVLTILGVTAKEKTANVAGLVIGLTLVFVHIVGIPLTGTSVNPARSLGPAIFAGSAALTDVWVFLLAPLVGAVLAVVVYRFFVKVK